MSTEGAGLFSRAVEAGAEAWNVNEAVDDFDRRDVTDILRAALPFLRAEWEADLLSDEVIERVADTFPHPWEAERLRQSRRLIEEALGVSVGGGTP